MQITKRELNEMINYEVEKQLNESKYKHNKNSHEIVLNTILRKIGKVRFVDEIYEYGYDQQFGLSFSSTNYTLLEQFNEELNEMFTGETYVVCQNSRKNDFAIYNKNTAIKYDFDII